MTNEYGVLHVSYDFAQIDGSQRKLPGDVKLKVNIHDPVNDYWVNWFHQLIDDRHVMFSLDAMHWKTYKRKVILTIEIDHAFPKEISNFNFGTGESIVTLANDGVNITNVKIESYE